LDISIRNKQGCGLARKGHGNAVIGVVRIGVSRVTEWQYKKTNATLIVQELYTSQPLGPSIKDVRTQWEGVVQCGQGGWVSSNADVRTFWCKKRRICRNLYSVSLRTGRGVEPSVRTREREVNCGRPLLMVPFYVFCNAFFSR